MDSRKKSYNREARRVVNVSIDETNIKPIRVELADRHQSYDESNPLVIPSSKRRTVVKRQHVQRPIILSKKRRKRLEKIVEQKKKNKKRSDVLQALSKIRTSKEILSKLIPVAEAQTKGRKRLYEIDEGEVVDKRKLRLPEEEDESKLQKNEDSGIINSGTEASKSDSMFESNIESDDDGTKFSADSITIKPIQITSSNAISDNNVKPTNNQSAPRLTRSDEKNSLSKIRTGEPEQNITPGKTFVMVNRTKEIERVRSKLTIIGEEQVIMETIHDNDVIIIVGSTGSGKTTQVPQFLYEAGYCMQGKMIGVTEPRRIAATSMSRRVADEMSLTSEEISYLIRYEGNVTPRTRIKFMTDGVLLEEIKKDFLLTSYSAIIVDEAHERSINTDILVGFLSLIVSQRRKRNNPLKLIIMSATLRLNDFIENRKLFINSPPVINVKGREYTLKIHFSKRTSENYMKEAFCKACKIHLQQPDGGILIFLTGQNEVNRLTKKLRDTFPLPRIKHGRPYSKQRVNVEVKSDSDDDPTSEDEDVDEKAFRKMLKNKSYKPRNMKLPEINLENYSLGPQDEITDQSGNDDSDEEGDFFFDPYRVTSSKIQPLYVLPLYSLLKTEEQNKVFESPPDGCRLCVVATNVAETSITIPHIKYVIDSGRVKMKQYDTFSGVSRFAVTWTSKASAEQRAGRAGRTSEGHCYRLYSSAVYNEFEEWGKPEIVLQPVDEVVLRLKTMSCERVALFPFPTPPESIQINRAEERLTLLGALEQYNKAGEVRARTKVTRLGMAMEKYTVAPRFAKMMLLCKDRELLLYTITIIAALSVQQFLLVPTNNIAEIWRKWSGNSNTMLLGDVMVVLNALKKAEYANTSSTNLEKFCRKSGLRYKAVIEARKVRQQLIRELNRHVQNLNLVFNSNVDSPDELQVFQLRKNLLSCMVDQVARRLTTDELKQAGLSAKKAAYYLPECTDIVYLHKHSILNKLKPPWIVYQEAYEENGKTYVRGITAIEPEWLPEYAKQLCRISSESREPEFDEKSGKMMCWVSSSFGRSGWPLPLTKIECPEDEKRYEYFAKSILDGIVCPSLREYRDELLYPSAYLIVPWGKSSLNVQKNLLNTLKNDEVDSREKLLQKWETTPEYLLDEYLNWIPVAGHEEIKSIWPPIGTRT